MDIYSVWDKWIGLSGILVHLDPSQDAKYHVPPFFPKYVRTGSKKEEIILISSKLKITDGDYVEIFSILTKFGLVSLKIL